MSAALSDAWLSGSWEVESTTDVRVLPVIGARVPKESSQVVGLVSPYRNQPVASLPLGLAAPLSCAASGCTPCCGTIYSAIRSATAA